MRAVVLVALSALLLLDAPAALAHRLSVFAYTEGSTIQGSAYFAGGGAAGSAQVTVYGPDGAVLGTTTTDEAGQFAFEATLRVDHRITVETADGHAAEFVVAATDLPASLPGGAEPSAIDVTAVEGTTAAEADLPGTMPAIDDAALEAMVSRAVQQQIRPLREDLIAYADAVRVSDIMGGIGYIVGIFGVLAYVLSLRRSRRSADRTMANRAAAE